MRTEQGKKKGQGLPLSSQEIKKGEGRGSSLLKKGGIAEGLSLQKGTEVSWSKLEVISKGNVKDTKTSRRASGEPERRGGGRSMSWGVEGSDDTGAPWTR